MKIFLKFLHFAVLIVCLIIQIVFGDYLKLYFINFDLIMLVVAAVAVFDGVIYGVAYGFVGGMLFDLLTANIIGVSALIYAVNAFIISRIIDLGFRLKIITYILIIFFITEINLLFISGVYYLFNFSLNVKQFGLEMIINPVCNIILMFIIFPVISAGKEKKEEFGFIYKNKA